MHTPKETQIRNDNPYFGPVIRIVEPIESYKSVDFDFTHKITVGAHGSKFDQPDGSFSFIDAWATYLWSPSRKEWCLGAS